MSKKTGKLTLNKEAITILRSNLDGVAGGYGPFPTVLGASGMYGSCNACPVPSQNNLSCNEKACMAVAGCYSAAKDSCAPKR